MYVAKSQVVDLKFRTSKLLVRSYGSNYLPLKSTFGVKKVQIDTAKNLVLFK